jgi:Rad3-related DNA helicase
MAEEQRQEQLEQEGHEQEQGQDPRNSDGSKNTDTEKRFTQAEVDEILRRRLERQEKQFAKKYGDDVEARLQRLAELEAQEEERKQAEMTELERLQAQLQQLQQERDALSQELETTRTRAQEQAIRNEFIKAATEKGIAYVDDAWTLAASRLAEVEFDDNGNPQGVAEIAESLAKEKPFLLKQETTPRTIGGGNSPKPAPEKSKEQRLKEAAEKARLSGRPEDRIAYRMLKQELS